ncbi:MULTISPECIES: ADP-glyceromanno-heptose 6-epimerase [unclassified Campylobacter]|uniref:ADP-glyceromanno-heptose 6-epimerase n=1 Tax=unclassified Campylobacter TaxID=2593542 RepID=UPI0022E9FD4C|nr:MULTISPECIES: ADP-glyceromanno-heptose 6-epimerase [unclassified Campylobacter]MDA3079469.1 ADP-glyceromanno-heptose 6-epimerase [Campylobacter sp. CS_NA2]MDA3081098.1 ADP-glyceromanno-heptose 6-epimerase [Campylobacter sp. CS_NA1]MDA3085649.1 ADP-glyceromanno-heptose 6-epimerase [Campylobacter sp. CS_ED1]MDA3090303.1 ADP-glyceromanno-heptose 6-epimerase [Campylobacter sp. CS_ED2]WBR50914.1 ADP-glyceromanno-heptose 6-epimerase [Campylobacter sp. CS_NA3]
MRIVITGGGGFIGSNLAKHFMAEHEVLVVDSFRSNKTFSNGNLRSFGHFKNLLGFDGEIYCGDICDEKTMQKIRHFKPDVIFHEAAISDTTVSEQDELLKVNLNSFYDLLEISRDLNAKLIYASSAATYGNASAPQKVFECENPNNVYGFSKLMMDKTALKFDKEFGTKTIGLRYFNVYGGGEFFKNKTASMVLGFGLQILKGNAPKLFVGSDKIFRDFIYIKDIINANELAMKSDTNGVFNVGTGNARSFQDIADILQNELGTSYGNEYIPNPFSSQYQFFTQADIEPTKNSLGYTPKWTLEAGIKDYLPEIIKIHESLKNG